MKGLKFLSVFIFGAVVATTVRADFPLKLSIDVSNKRNTYVVSSSNNGETKIERVNVDAKIRKAGGQEYTGELTAELYIIGQKVNSGYYGIIDIVKTNFCLTAENDQTFELKTKPYEIGYASGNMKTGARYETYLLVVVDKEGKIIDWRCGRALSQKGIDFIRKQGVNTVFDRDGYVLGKENISLTQGVRASVIANAIDNDDD